MPRHAEIPLAQIQSARSDTSITATKHLWNQSVVENRARLLYFGPQGDKNGGSTFDIWNGHRRWPYVDGDAVASTTLDDVCVRPFWSSGSVELRCMFLATHLTDQIPGPTEFDELANLAAQSEWELKYQAYELSDDLSPSAWNEAYITTQTKTVNVRHWPTDSSGFYPCLQQAHWSRFGALPDNYALTYKEGQLRADDFGFLSFETIKLDYETETTLADGGNFPLRFKLSAYMTGTPTFNGPIKGSPLAPSENNQYLRLQLISLAAYNRPQA